MPTLKLSNNIIGITLGDPAGIGPEITYKAVRNFQKKNKKVTFKIIGDDFAFNTFGFSKLPNCELVKLNPTKIHPIKIEIGVPSIASAQASVNYLNCAVNFLKTKQINSLVTAPICKESICKINKKFQGHTEFLQEAFRIKNTGMLFVTDKMRVMIATRHMPLSKVPRSITEKLIIESVELVNTSLKQIFKIRSPKIALCGLNPHAGERGIMGTEEIKVIIPAITKLKRKRIKVSGPFPADTLFYESNSKNYDLILAMYHDQGLTPIKTLHFKNLVNLTVGLPFIRTSPAHGTAFNIAGKGIADASSMLKAIEYAHSLSK